LAALEEADDAGLRHAGGYLEAQVAKAPGDDTGRADLFEAGFRMGVKVAACFDKFVQDRFG
jgi:hypothetical protein